MALVHDSIHHRHAQSSGQSWGHALVPGLSPSVPHGTLVTPLLLRLPAACNDNMAELPRRHAGHGKQYVVAQYLCLIAHAKASNTWPFLVYSDRTGFKTLNSLARLTGLDAGAPPLRFTT